MNSVFSTVALAIGLGAASATVAQNMDEGADLYQTYCATCHGLEATGHGPMRSVLLIPPSDLTTMTQRYDGTFPVLRVVQRIDGRDPLVSHGSPMPVYGDFFEGDDTALKTPAGQPIMTSRAVADLVAFLQGIQK